MSEQMDRLMRRYSVTTEQELIRAIAEEYTVETGEFHSLADAELMLDGMLEAEYQKIAGGEATKAVREQARIVTSTVIERYGDALTRLADEDREPIDRYGTLEHEAWLIEMERRDDYQ